MRAKEKVSWSRIDYFLISESLQTRVVESSISPSVCSDHSLISITVDISETLRGPAVWKFNNELLNDSEFIKNLKDKIQLCRKSFAYLPQVELWDLLKFEIKQYSRDWVVSKVQESHIHRFYLYEKLSRMQVELLHDPCEKPEVCLIRNIDLVHSELEAYEIRDAKKAAFRCKKTWIASGETHSKYFFNLEKRNFNTKTVYMVHKKRQGPDERLL